ncbi:MAG TPA: flagellar biosynthesis protein FlhB [Thermoanaerobacterales bacterium]|nr:flagellar biosynthesis protein FlhB [Thermoanaerobacterales bacterium]
MNLQLFAQEKTEKATPRRRQKARERGQVFSSRELNSAFILLASFIIFRIAGRNSTVSMTQIFNYFLIDSINREDIFTQIGIISLFYETLRLILRVVFPIILGIFCLSLLVNYMQVGFVLSLEPISPKLERINPLEGLKRIFSRRSLLELLKSIFKISLIAYVVYTVINKHKNLFPLMLDMSLGDSLSLILSIAFEMGIRAAITLLIMAVFDYFYQWYEYEKGLMMSKQDIKEEYKEVEGNPQIKSRIRQIQRQMARSRMMKDVEKADVIITNPTHYAVALAYDSALHFAPVVLAKGVDKLAERIKEIALKKDIPIVENKELAQTLYKTVEVGDVIPESLYNAVAEILAFVYSMRERRL